LAFLQRKYREWRTEGRRAIVAEYLGLALKSAMLPTIPAIVANLADRLWTLGEFPAARPPN
jgi:hypothetical protein